MSQFSKPKLSVLTDPLPIGLSFFSESFRKYARTIKYVFKKRSFNNDAIYRGHPSVTRSLIYGLGSNNISFNYNPKKLVYLSDTVIVLAGVRTLQQAIKLKRSRKIKKLFAGPNITNFSTDYNSLLNSCEIDGVITPSQWVAASYLRDSPSLQGRIYTWPAGVDANFFSPKKELRSKKIILFVKDAMGSVGSMRPYLDYLQQLGWNVVLLKYSTYTHKEYRDLLRESCLLIGFTRSESQGIAWAEAWATDVPTLIWRNDREIFQGNLLGTSSAPYLCDRNGLFFDDFKHFKEQFTYWSLHQGSFKPREWVIENMTDEVSAKCLCQLIEQC